MRYYVYMKKLIWLAIPVILVGGYLTREQLKSAISLPPISQSAAGSNSWTAKLWDGSTVLASTETNVPTPFTRPASLSLYGAASGISGTWYISVAGNGGPTGSILATAPDSGPSGSASVLTALRVG